MSKTVGITFSTFDLLHAGHIAMLEEAKAQCDYLIVGLQSDPTIDRPDTKNKPIQTMARIILTKMPRDGTEKSTPGASIFTIRIKL